MTSHQPSLAFRYYLGLTHGNGRETFEALTAQRKVALYLNRTEIAPGCTITPGAGWFLGDSEDCLQIYVSGIQERDHKRFLCWLRSEFHQRWIAYEAAPVLHLFGSDDLEADLLPRAVAA